MKPKLFFKIRNAVLVFCSLCWVIFEFQPMVYGAETVVQAENFEEKGENAELVTLGDVTQLQIRISRGTQWGLLGAFNPQLPAGRYRAWFSLSSQPFSEKNTLGSLFILCDVAVDERTVRTRAGFNGGDFPSERRLKDFSIEFSVPRGSEQRCEIGWEGEGVPQIFSATQARFVRLDQGVGVSHVRANKILYEPGERGTLHISLTNFTDRATQVTLRTELMQEVATVSANLPPVTVPIVREASIEIPFTAPQWEYGCEARVTASVSDQVVDSGSDVFNISTNVWQVGLGAQPGYRGHTATLSEADIVEDVELVRQQYGNMVEKSFWPPSDWDNMAPAEQVTEWISGQTARYEKRARILQFHRLAGQQGIKMMTYGKHHGDGHSGWQAYRARPDWYFTTEYAPWSDAPSGELSSHDYRWWDDIPYHTKYRERFRAQNWSAAPPPDFRKLDVLDFGIDNLLASTAMFGWDGVRFDGHWTAGNDELSAWNARRMKERVWADYPEFRFGFNYSYTPGEYLLSWTEDGMWGGEQELQENMAGGGMYMHEAIRNFEFSPGKTYTTWRELALREAEASKYIHSLGGNYHWILAADELSARDARYKLAIASMIGAHPSYGDQASVRPRGWGRFLTRWSAFIYDPNLKPVEAGELISISTPVPLWWKEFARERVADENTKQIIVHLLNSPREDAINVQSQNQLPVPVTNVRVLFQAGDLETLERVVFLDPDADSEVVQLEPELENGRYVVDIPPVSLWAMVVFEIKGDFTLPSAMPRFSEEPDLNKVEEGRRSRGITTCWSPGHFREAPVIGQSLAVFSFYKWSSGVKWITGDQDSQSPNRIVTRSDFSTSRLSNSHQINWIAPPRPGRYLAVYRIKADQLEPNVSIQLTANFSEGETFHVFFDRTLNTANDFRQAGVYQEFPVDFEYLEEGHVTFGTSPAVSENNGVNFDSLTLIPLEIYDDLEMQKRFPEVRTTDNFRIGGDERLNILWVRSMFDEFYKIEEALREIPNVTLETRETVWGIIDTEPPHQQKPIDYDTLAQADAVILSNATAPRRYSERKALADFVSQGGGLIVLGGPYSFAQGGFKYTFQESQMGINLRGGADLERFDAPAPLIPSNETFVSRGIPPKAWDLSPPLVYWYHRIEEMPKGEKTLFHLWADTAQPGFQYWRQTQLEVGRAEWLCF